MESIKKKAFYVVLASLLGIFVIMQWGHFQGPALEEYTETRSLFGTDVSLQCYHDKGDGIFPIIEAFWQRLEEIHVSMNALSTVGDVARINESGFHGVKVPSDLYGLLHDSLEFSRLTGGAFDVTIFPLVELWRNAIQEGFIPDNVAVKKAKDRVGYQYIRLEEDNMVYLKKKDMKVDLGAIAKGYAIDEVAGILAENEVEHFLIDAGGDIFCKGRQEGKKAWNVGMQDPLDKDKLLGILGVSGVAVTTSGNYERFSEIEGKRFSHIIDPLTGYPQDLVVQAIVIAPSAKEADAYATALCVMGAKKGLRLINSLGKMEAMIVENKKGKVSVHRTKSFNDLLL